METLTLVLFIPTDRRAAKRLDEGFGMREGVRTMLEFKNADGQMVRLQRKSTERALDGRGVFGLLPRKLLILLTVPVISVALLIAAAVVPSAKPEIPDDSGTGGWVSPSTSATPTVPATVAR